jgi:hypothetical protein
MGSELGAQRAGVDGSRQGQVRPAPTTQYQNLRKPLGVGLIVVGSMGLLSMFVLALGSGPAATAPVTKAGAGSAAHVPPGSTTVAPVPVTTAPVFRPPVTTAPTPVLHPPVSTTLPPPVVHPAVTTVPTTVPPQSPARSAVAAAPAVAHKNSARTWTPRRYNLGHPKFTPRRFRLGHPTFTPRRLHTPSTTIP